MFNHADVHCSICDKTMHIRWMPDDPQMVIDQVAQDAHQRESPLCKATSFTVEPYAALDPPSVNYGNSLMQDFISER